MNIGENVKKKRIACGLTQQQLAEIVGVAAATICQIERGTKTLSMPLGKQIAEVLNCTLDSLAN